MGFKSAFYRYMMMAAVLSAAAIVVSCGNKLKNIDADKAFARRITCNDTPYVSFFLDDFSKPILQYIVTRILKKNKATEDSVRNIFGDFRKIVLAFAGYIC